MSCFVEAGDMMKHKSRERPVTDQATLAGAEIPKGAPCHGRRTPGSR
jgi:hypothetical protein